MRNLIITFLVLIGAFVLTTSIVWAQTTSGPTPGVGTGSTGIGTTGMGTTTTIPRAAPSTGHG